MTVDKQIAIIYAGTRGYLDEYDPRELAEYEKQLLSHLESNHADVLSSVREEKVISDDNDKKLTKILDDFKGIFARPELSIV
jgi:F-type H+-transporting ATPase subunit alpha